MVDCNERNEGSSNFCHEAYDCPVLYMWGWMNKWLC